MPEIQTLLISDNLLTSNYKHKICNFANCKRVTNNCMSISGLNTFGSRDLYVKDQLCQTLKQAIRLSPPPLSLSHISALWLRAWTITGPLFRTEIQLNYEAWEEQGLNSSLFHHKVSNSMSKTNSSLSYSMEAHNFFISLITK